VKNAVRKTRRYSYLFGIASPFFMYPLRSPEALATAAVLALALLKVVTNGFSAGKGRK
jgi:hypothetical protein